VVGATAGVGTTGDATFTEALLLLLLLLSTGTVAPVLDVVAAAGVDALLMALLLGCVSVSSLTAGDGDGAVAPKGLNVCGCMDQHLYVGGLATMTPRDTLWAAKACAMCQISICKQ
jgi:hypothetical protein